MPTTEANGQKLYYEAHGEGEPLLCVMGLGADTLAWAFQIPAWSREFRMIVFDNRDVGRSSHATGHYEVRDMAADTLALAGAIGLDRFHLVGVSLGGTIAQEMALAAPERVRTLTLCVSYGGGGRWMRERARLLGAQALRMSREELLDFLMLLTLSEDFYADEEAVARARELLLRNPNPQPPDAFVRQLEAGSRHEARDRLRSLRMPVHVIGAEHDMLVPHWKSPELADLIPGARLTMIPGAPHGLNWERAEDFNAAVVGFVRERTG